MRTQFIWEKINNRVDPEVVKVIMAQQNEIAELTQKLVFTVNMQNLILQVMREMMATFQNINSRSLMEKVAGAQSAIQTHEQTYEQSDPLTTEDAYDAANRGRSGE